MQQKSSKIVNVTICLEDCSFSQLLDEALANLAKKASC